MNFPTISESKRLQRLAPPGGKVRMVLDTDTYNEIDDQFAVVHALLSPKKLKVEALYAAPFHNDRSSGPADGMEKSYEEILRLLDRLDVSSENIVYPGSRGFLAGAAQPQPSAAAEDLVRRASAESEEPLYVVAIGAITNVASALLKEPGIIENIVVVWLGGQPQHWPQASQFNLSQDIHAARVVFDSGVPLVHVPCHGVSSHLLTTVEELRTHVAGRSAIGDYLVDIFEGFFDDHYAHAKEIWDVATIAWLLDPAWVPSVLRPSSALTDDEKWVVDPGRHAMREAIFVHRNPVFADLFRKVGACR